MADGLLTEGEAACNNHGLHLGKRRFKIFIDYNVLEFGRMRHFGTSAEQTARDRLFGIRAAVVKAPFESLDGGRQDEDADRAVEAFTDLTGALPVDLEKNVVALGHLAFDQMRLVP